MKTVIDYPLKEKSSRINSIDVFRGLTIFAMIFVNDLAGVRNIPAWMKHVPPEADGMTFVDVVFPAFLFIVGMAIPFAISFRVKSGFTTFQNIKHIIVRAAGLLILGILMVNMGGFNSEAAGINKHLWILLVFISAILTWNSYPKKSVNERYFFHALRLFGILGLIVSALIYRGGTANNIHWLQTSWWGILGLIGWAYLAGSLSFLLWRKYPYGLFGMMLIFTLMFFAEKAGLFNFLYVHFNSLFLGMQLGSHASIVTAGILLSLILTSPHLDSLKKRIIAMIIFSFVLFATGVILQPEYGINKNFATPAWCYYSSSICVVVFILLYLIIDHLKINKWSNFLKPAGMNPLLAYILPSIFYSLLTLSGVTIYSELSDGFIGIIRSLLFTFFIIWITNYLTKLNIRLHL